METLGRLSSTDHCRPEDKDWLSSLSHSQLDLLISIKKLVMHRAKVAGFEEWGYKFDLKMLRAIYIVLEDTLHERLRKSSCIPNQVADSLSSLQSERGMTKDEGRTHRNPCKTNEIMDPYLMLKGKLDEVSEREEPDADRQMSADDQGGLHRDAVHVDEEHGVQLKLSEVQDVGSSFIVIENEIAVSHRVAASTSTKSRRNEMEVSEQGVSECSDVKRKKKRKLAEIRYAGGSGANLFTRKGNRCRSPCLL